MNFLQTDLAKTFWILICVGVFIALLWGLVKSAMASLQRSNGSWKSIIDEILVGILVIACFVIIVQMDLATLVGYLMKPVQAVFNMVINFLRQVGLPV